MSTSYSGGDPSVSLAGAGAQGGSGGGPAVAGPDGAPSSATSHELYDYLVSNRGSASWIVAVQGADQAATIELATGEPVMAMGGFSGTDPTPTLDQLKAYVASGQLRYVIVGGNGPGGDRGGSSDVTSWITTNGSLVASISGVSLYDLSGAAS